ncbi:uncharacterized protein LOC131323230 isoform X1 [Rhododendron vialii]|uniref:uncharacterized protein LOC131323230 isoform X1 n=1 Tax=Rhododendron vialii TaxID=182163 RepID=UPI00265ECC82|nr:uncharacterized protein LOC131323230 isoform X1 [Rhododendron vialii]
MAQFRTISCRHFHKLLNPQNPSQYLKNPLRIHSNTTHYYKPTLISVFNRPISLSSQFQHESSNLHDTHDRNSKPKKPLHLLFKEAVGLSGKIEVENEVEDSELKKKLRKLEEEVRKLTENRNEREILKKLVKKSNNGDGSKELRTITKSLHLLFANNDVGGGGGSEKSEGMANLGMEDPRVYKELSREMVEFVTHLFEKGYFRDANFLPRNKFDVTCFENSYGRDFVKYAAEKFGKDNREIAKWLSASDMKRVAAFGCPSLGRKNIFSAKRLRYFFGIQEDTVCSKCILKPSCKFVNQSVWRGDNKNLDLVVVMRVITLYALESVPPQLVVPDEIKDSVNRLLKEVVNLSEAVA